jgi:glycosyltransferase involved in cell wall biosynthesis
MRTWLVTIGEPLPLTPAVQRLRVGLLADALVSRGHTVTWWASTFDHFSKTQLFADDAAIDICHGYRIRALRGCAYRKNISLQRYVDHGLIARKFRKLARLEEPPDVIVASMPDYKLAFEAAQYARESRVPFVVDVRDQWPDLYLDVLPAALRPAASLALRSDFSKLQSLLGSADSVVSMVDQLLDWALQRGKRQKGPDDRVFYLGAQAPDVTSRATARGLRSELAGKFVITYIGTFGHHNNPSVLIDAARLLQARSAAAEDVRFVVAGDGVLRSSVVESAEGLRGVTFPGWLESDDLNALLQASSVAVLPWSSPLPAFPNKAFHYLHAGLPIAASVSGELQQLLIAHHAGDYFEPGSASDLAALLSRWISDRPLVDTMSRNAKRLAVDRLDASRIYPEFAAHVEHVARTY